LIIGGVCGLSAKNAFAKDNLSDPPSVPFSYNGHTYYHVMYWTSYSGETEQRTAVFFNSTVQTPSDSGGNGTPTWNGGTQPSGTVASVGGIGTTESTYWGGNSDHDLAEIKGTNPTDIQFFHNCNTDFSQCDAESWSDIVVDIYFVPTGQVVGFYSDLPVYDYYSHLGGCIGSSCTAPDTSTHFISVTPADGSVVATTTTLEADLFANLNDFNGVGLGFGSLFIKAKQDSASSCTTSLYKSICQGENAPTAKQLQVYIGTTTSTGILSGDYNMSDTVTFPTAGKWDITYEIVTGTAPPWYCAQWLFGSDYCGIQYSAIVSTTTTIIVGYKLPIDTVLETVASSSVHSYTDMSQTISDILASTTAQFADACNPIGGSFNAGNCLTLAFWPGSSAINDDFTILKETPPWGYVFRFIDILNATTSTSSLPKVQYTLSTTSPFYPYMTDITFDPLGAIGASGDLINQVRSDQAQPMTLWQIVMPAVNTIVYLTLGFMIIKDLTNIHKHDKAISAHRDRNQKV